jgi:hypothetical protein
LSSSVTRNFSLILFFRTWLIILGLFLSLCVSFRVCAICIPSSRLHWRNLIIALIYFAKKFSLFFFCLFFSLISDEVYSQRILQYISLTKTSHLIMNYLSTQVYKSCSCRFFFLVTMTFFLNFQVLCVMAITSF